MAYERVGPEGEQALTDDLRAFLEAANTAGDRALVLEAGVPRGDRDPRLSAPGRPRTAARTSAAGPRIVAPMKSTARKTSPATGPPWPKA